MKTDSSKYRAVLDTFWADMDVLEWTPDEKLFYLWVFTNQHLDICGCYQVSTKVMAHETGVTLERIQELIAKFSSENKIRYNFETRELLILNWKKHNEGFFRPENKNSVKAISEGAARIKSEELRNVVLLWLGVRVAPAPPPTQAPAPQPKPKPEPEPEQRISDDASSQASTTPLPPTTDKKQRHHQQPDNEQRIRQAFEERKAFLTERFPWLDLAVEAEQCVAKYQNKAIGADAAVLVLEWCKRNPKPEARGRDRPTAGKGVERGERVRRSFDAIDRVTRAIDASTGV